MTKLQYLLIWVSIGYVVSAYMIHYYFVIWNRIIKKRHVLLALIGPWVWPLQIIKHIMDQFTIISGTIKRTKYRP